MKIETYEIEEIKSSEASLMAADSEAIELIEKLGLKGQSSLLNKDTATRFPYPKVTAVQEFVFKQNFPQATALEQFSSGIIPLRVLQVAAFCKQFPQTAYLEVWHPIDVRKDPVLVGRDSRWSSESYLLARWGEALEPFEQLQAKAKEIWTAKTRSKLTGFLAMLDDIAQTAALTGEIKAELNWS